MARQSAPAPILYEDRHLVVVNKPAGLLSIPGPDGGPDLAGLLDAWLAARDGQGAVHVHPCHRLDRDTSGLMLFAKGKAAQKTMMSLFAERETTKIYLAVVNGLVGPEQGTLREPVDGKPALTQFQVLGRGENFTVLKCKIHTGRTNQIRIHCAGMGHALVGDDRFGRRKDFAFPARRTLLHAWYAAFPWPWEAEAPALGKGLATGGTSSGAGLAGAGDVSAPGQIAPAGVMYPGAVRSAVDGMSPAGGMSSAAAQTLFVRGKSAGFTAPLPPDMAEVCARLGLDLQGSR